MNIGIITVFDSPNYGAFLQAFAMKTILEKIGHNVFFIKFRDKKSIKKICLGKSSTIREKYRYILHYKDNITRFHFTVNDCMKLSTVDYDEIVNNDLDAIILGSDEIWNSHVNIFQNSFFYGDGIDVRYKYAYAPSIGSASDEDVNKYLGNYSFLSNVNIIGVRDERSQLIIRRTINITPPIVCDPTCLVGRETFDNVGMMPVTLSPYLLVYSYGVSKNMQKILIHFAKEHNLLLVSLCMKHNWCDKHINISALDFYHIIKNADYVYTSTFHGTIFTFMNHKKCVISANAMKVKDFISKVKMKQVTILNEDYESVSAILEKNVDYNDYDLCIKEYRDYSYKLLVNSLSTD